MKKAFKSSQRRAIVYAFTVAAISALQRRYQGTLNISGVVNQMMEDSSLLNLMNNPLAQFGPTNFPFLGATLLPERVVPLNAWTEEKIQFRTIIANDSTRYSPVQKKGGMLYSSLKVELGNSNIGQEFSGQDYDAFITALHRFGSTDNIPSMEAVTRLLNWVDIALLRPLLVKNEKQRFEALVNAQVVRTGDNNYREVVNFPNPSGHRVNAGGVWSNNSYDPYPDVIDMAEFLWGLGFTINRILARRTVTSKLTLNAFIRTRVGRISLASGTVTGLAGRASLADINEMFSSDDLPPIERYDLQYRTQTGSAYYLDSASMLFVCTTGRDETVDMGDSAPLIMPNTLGYVGVGTPAGQPNPGRVVNMAVKTDHPPRIEGEGVQVSFPVFTEPEAVGVIKNIS